MSEANVGRSAAECETFKGLESAVRDGSTPYIYGFWAENGGSFVSARREAKGFDRLWSDVVRACEVNVPKASEDAPAPSGGMSPSEWLAAIFVSIWVVLLLVFLWGYTLSAPCAACMEAGR